MENLLYFHIIGYCSTNPLYTLIVSVIVFPIVYYAEIVSSFSWENDEKLVETLTRLTTLYT